MSRLNKIHPLIVFSPFYFFLLFGTEWALLFRESLRTKTNPQAIVPHFQLHHTYKPNIEFTIHPSPKEDFVPAQNLINEMRMRGPIPGKKTAHRILLIGDSFVQADEVVFDKTFGQLLNSKFNHKVEFITHGMVSWSPTTEFSWLYHQGFTLNPDEIVLFLCINDFFDSKAFNQSDAVYRNQAIYQNNIPISYNLPDLNWLQWIKNNSALVRLVNHAYKDWIRNRGSAIIDKIPNVRSETIDLNLPASLWSPQQRTNIDETLKVVANIHDTTLSLGIKLHTALVPMPFAWPDEAVAGKAFPPYNWPADFKVNQKGIETYVRNYTSKLGIGWIDLRKGFNEEKSRKSVKLYNNVDGHWNEEGHRVVSNILVEYFNAIKSD